MLLLVQQTTWMAWACTGKVPKVVLVKASTFVSCLDVLSYAEFMPWGSFCNCRLLNTIQVSVQLVITPRQLSDSAIYPTRSCIKKHVCCILNIVGWKCLSSDVFILQHQVRQEQLISNYLHFFAFAPSPCRVVWQLPSAHPDRWRLSHRHVASGIMWVQHPDSELNRRQPLSVCGKASNETLNWKHSVCTLHWKPSSAWATVQCI